jgi:hypothetical protein
MEILTSKTAAVQTYPTDPPSFRQPVCAVRSLLDLTDVRVLSIYIIRFFLRAIIHPMTSGVWKRYFHTVA